MRQLISDSFPNHGIIGEEFGSSNAEAEYVWVLDPIDGTKSFICGFPTWGTLIGLTHRGQACYGMMSQPFIRERFYGDGRAAYWRGPTRAPAGIEERRKLSVRACPSLEQAILMTTSPLLIEPEQRPVFHNVEKECVCRDMAAIVMHIARWLQVMLILSLKQELILMISSHSYQLLKVREG